ncbi:hypothetical protein FD755_024322 [Muntiacus reevesi]|uniref:B-cell receptor-associated protein n=1 Tax=Muntiacus reevesi TaxID=9886 RepID=A0A5N3VAR4_MUNRE|nr:hypothetical protein FD755_024322 [Muntiacus reevesi]
MLRLSWRRVAGFPWGCGLQNCMIKDQRCHLLQGCLACLGWAELTMPWGYTGATKGSRSLILESTCHWKLFLPARNHLLRRLVTLISQQATLLASNEAFKKQAESASDAAKKYMEENDLLKKEAGGVTKLGGRDSEVKVQEENRSLKADLKRLKDELAVNKQKLEKAENEALAMRKQSKGLTKEYDRLLEEHAKLQAAVDGPSDKKEE